MGSNRFSGVAGKWCYIVDRVAPPSSSRLHSRGCEVGFRLDGVQVQGVEGSRDEQIRGVDGSRYETRRSRASREMNAVMARAARRLADQG